MNLSSVRSRLYVMYNNIGDIECEHNQRIEELHLQLQQEKEQNLMLKSNISRLGGDTYLMKSMTLWDRIQFVFFPEIYT